MRILITGAAGTGTTTLGQALARELAFAFFDADYYYWLASDPPFQHKQDAAIRLSRILEDLRVETNAVIAGSIMNWGSELEDSLSLIAFLTLSADIRVARLKVREMSKYGRVDPIFLQWAAQYDDGKMSGRSLQRHEAWLSTRKCRIVRFDGDGSIASRVQQLSSYIKRLASDHF